MAATQTQVLEPEVAGPEGLPDQKHIAPDPKTSDERDEEQAREAAKLRPEREAKLSDYYVSFPYISSNNDSSPLDIGETTSILLANDC